MYVLLICCLSLFFFPYICPPSRLVFNGNSHNNWSPWFSMSARSGPYVTTVYQTVVCKFLYFFSFIHVLFINVLFEYILKLGYFNFSEVGQCLN